MNESLKVKIVRKLDELEDEAGRQLLDYLEFLESRYNRSRRGASALERIAEGIGDSLSAGKITDAAAKGTAQVVDAAGRVMAGLAAASKVVAEELQPRVEDRAGAAHPADEEAEATAHGGHDGESAGADAAEQSEDDARA